MFFTGLIAKERRAIRHQKRSALYWGTPEQKYAFGHPLVDGFIGAIAGTILILALIAG